MKITWLGHSSVRIDAAGHRVYIDPYAGDDSEYAPASLVLVSRFDFDHCSMQKLGRLRGEQTLILGTSALAREVYPSRALRVGETVAHDGIEVIGMPVLSAHEDAEGHEDEDAIGFLIIAENKRVYFMGDSAFEEEMVKARPDVLLIAVGGTFSAGPREAAKIAGAVAPKLAIPIHWGRHAGTQDDADFFAELCRVPVRVLQQGGSVTL